ncbi:MAG TPA: HAMP domain-containing sensor histidine kinase [Chthoniobacteraceae bacterium]|nr:HAMP domain-containing sensor histidine kinase [Chthoniobacteraceae bacterium]
MRRHSAQDVGVISKQRSNTFWWSAFMLVPLVLLAALGIRGIAASRRDTLEGARAEAARVVDYGVRIFEQRLATLRASARALPQYPQVPQPVEGADTEATYERAVAAPPEEGEALLTKLLEERPDAQTPAGLPVAALVEWFRVQNCNDAAELPERVQQLAIKAVQSHPSILTTALLDRARDLLIERGATEVSLEPWRQRWKEDETVRALIGPNLPSGKWVADEAKRWWVEPDGERLRVLSDKELAAIADDVAKETGGLAVQSVAFSVRWADHILLGGSENGEELAARVSGPLSIKAALVDPSAMYRRQKWQTFWLASLLGVALLAVIGGFYVMQRALHSERQLNEQKGDFVASVSHELRAPVASMRLMLENLESGAVKEEASRQDYLTMIGGECRRLSTLIENVLDFARIEHGRKFYEMAEADVSALIHDAIQLLRPRASQRRQDLRAQIEPLDPVPRIDALAIQQAVINLIDNAVKFSPEGSTVVVSVASRNVNTWEIAVTDDGPGIPKHERERIFERFYRIGSELRRETQGSGIGLSIVKHTVEAHGGRVEVGGNGDAGAKFTLVLPYTIVANE